MKIKPVNYTVQNQTKIHTNARTKSQISKEERYYTASPTRLIIMRFLNHKLAIIGFVILSLFYLSAVFASFLSLNDPEEYFDDYTFSPPQFPRFIDSEGLSIRPFYYALEKIRDPETLQMKYTFNTDKRLYIEFFKRGYR